MCDGLQRSRKGEEVEYGGNIYISTELPSDISGLLKARCQAKCQDLRKHSLISCGRIFFSCDRTKEDEYEGLGLHREARKRQVKAGVELSAGVDCLA